MEMAKPPVPKSHSDCRCSFVCAGQAGCIACWIYDRGRCLYQCYTPAGEPVYTVLAADEVVEKVGLDGHVDLRMRNASLGEVGRLLARVTDARIYVPADRIDERQDLYLEDASLDTVVRELGLMAVERP